MMGDVSPKERAIMAAERAMREWISKVKPGVTYHHIDQSFGGQTLGSVAYNAIIGALSSVSEPMEMAAYHEYELLAHGEGAQIFRTMLEAADKC